MNSDVSFTITEKQIAELAEEIKKSYSEVQFAGGGPAAEFCKVWPAASEGLTALKGVLALVPGISVFAGAAIGIVIAAGNAASTAVCTKK
jgi:hypothetical protein